jgi:hypothetical protein
MRELLKDFAGPATTIVAAFAVSAITWWYNKRQTQIGIEKLKVDLLRYAIYEAAKTLTEHLVASERVDLDKVIRLRVILGEACFFFGDDIVRGIEEIDKEAQSLLEGVVRLRAAKANDQSDENAADKIAASQKSLLKMRTGLWRASRR